MEIGKKLKDARMKSGFTQETVAEKINVSRQTISNWENEKSYPDIISVIALSDLYSISLDDLLKGDREMMEHLEECTNVVKSTQKLIGAIILNDRVEYCFGCDIWCSRSCWRSRNRLSDLQANGA